MRRLGLAVAALAALAGCGGTSHAPSATPTATATETATATATPGPPAAIANCGIEASGWKAVGGVKVEAAAKGSGPAVIFANDSGNDPCDFAPLAESLAKHGHRVALFAYSDTSSSGERAALAETLALAKAVAGGKPYALVGASLGGRIVIEAAARHPAGLAAIVSLSGERTVQDYRDILADARRVSAPTLYLGSRQDPLTDGVRQQRELHAAMHGRPNLLVQQPGAAHGVELIIGGTGTPPAKRIAAFVRKELR